MTLDRAEAVHLLFRGAGEHMKWTRMIAAAFEIFAAVIALSAINADHETLRSYQPLVALLLLFGTSGLRHHANAVAGYSEHCRKLAFYAFALGKDITTIELSDAKLERPWTAEWLAKRLPASNLEEYYEPTFSPGEDRMREMCAHSAFYTWQLQHRAGWVYSAIFLALVVVSVVAFYSLGVNQAMAQPAGQPVPAQLLEAICSGVLVTIGIRVFESVLQFRESAQAAGSVAKRLVDKPLPMGVNLERIVSRYDLGRCVGGSVPTIIYSSLRDELQTQWLIRRTGLKE